MVEQLSTPSELLGGFAMVESARWHDDRLWFAHWGVGEVIAVDMDGKWEVMASGPPQMGWAIDWLDDNTLLTTGPSVRRHNGDGNTSTYSEQSCNEIVVDQKSHIYIDGFEFDFLGGGKPEPGWIDLVHGDGTTQRVADGIEFPNGMVITPDGNRLVVAESMGRRLSGFDIEDDGSLFNRKVWAENLGPDGICIDSEFGIWSQTADTFAHTQNSDAPQGACVRVLEGGEITHRVETDIPCYSCVLGGPDGHHLFLLCNEFEGVDQMKKVQERRSAKILVTDAPVKC